MRQQLGPSNKKAWDKEDFAHGKMSLRHWGEGTVVDGPQEGTETELLSKQLWEANVCSYCDSPNTFHAYCQRSKSRLDNVWRFRQYSKLVPSRTEEGRQEQEIFIAKHDFCFECQKEFLIETFHYVIRQKRRTEECDDTKE